SLPAFYAGVRPHSGSSRLPLGKTRPAIDGSGTPLCQWLFDDSKCNLRSNCSSKSHQIAVVPIVPRLRRCASERPQPDTFVIDAKQVRKAPNRSFRVRSQSRRAVEQVLRRVVGGISDEGLWVNDEPGLAFCPEDVACVQVG